MKRNEAILALIVLLYICLIIPGLNKPMIIDENVFVDAAKSIAETGKPYISDLKTFDNRNYDGSQVFYFHPPLYLDILALIIKAFGENIIAIRAFSAIAMIASGLLVYFITKKASEKAALAATFIFLINPLTVRSGLLIDINGTILLFSILLFTYFFLKWDTEGKIFPLGLLMGLVMWSKFEGILLLSASLFLYLLLKRGAKKAITLTALITGIGISIFLATFYFVSIIQGIDFLSPFQRNASAIPFIGNPIIPQLIHAAWAWKNFSFWLTPAFFLLSIYLLIRIAIRRIKKMPMKEADFLAIFAFVNLSFSLLIARDAYGFPKYIIEAVPFLSILLASLFHEEGLQKLLEGRRNLAIISLILAGALVYSFLILKDPFLAHNMFWTENVSITTDMAAYIRSNIMGILFFAPIFAAAALAFLIRGPLKKTILLSMFLLLVFFSLYVDYIQATAQYSTIYTYGQKGFEETAKYVREQSSGDSLFARIDFCYHTRLKCYRNYFEEDLTKESFKEAMGDANLKWAILSIKDREETYPGFSEKFKLEKEIGHFRIYHAESFSSKA